MTTPQGRFTLAELANASGLSPRTIRYYTGEGLLPPPQERGRYAIYSDDHLRRLQLIGRLKAAYLPLAAIRERLSKLGDAEIATMLQGEQRAPAGGAQPAPPALHQVLGQLAPEASTAGFGFRVSASLAGSHARPSALRAPHPATGYAALFPYPDEDAPDVDVPGDSRSELWQRVALAPGVELHVRAPLSPELSGRLDRLIDLARAILEPRIDANMSE